MSDITENTVVNKTFTIREFANRAIYRCKESAYGEGTDASNEMEGDYGKWDDWEDVLCDFAVFILRNAKT
jgi:hypothetical protein